MNQLALLRRRFLLILVILTITAASVGCDFKPSISTLEAPGKMGPQPFSTFQGNRTMIPLGKTFVPTYPKPIVTPSYTQGKIEFGICGEYDKAANKCFGDEKYGFQKLQDGKYRIFFEGKCYLLEGDPDQIEAATSSLKTITTLQDENNELGPQVVWALIALGPAAVLALAGCGVITVATVGAGAAVCILGVIASIGAAAPIVLNIQKMLANNEEIKVAQQVLRDVISLKPICS